jgi:hypothetical protein
MKYFHLSIDTSKPAPAWGVLAWSRRNALRSIVDLVALTHPREQRDDLRAGLRGWRARREASAAICRTVRELIDPDGPNVLEVSGIGHADILWTTLLDPVWHLFSHHLLSVGDTVEPENFRPSLLQRFDRISCFCGVLADQYHAHCGVTTTLSKGEISALDFHSLRTSRPVDMIVVGRRQWDFHTPVHEHYNSPDSNRLFLDFVTRPQKALLPETEWRLLMSTYAKSKIAFCFEPSDIPRFKSRSALTHRWLQAWTAGCTVIGRRPTGPGVAELIDWPESTIEVPANPAEWIPFLEEILDDKEGLERRRQRNVVEALRRFDTRIRFAKLLADLGLSPTEAHRRELARLAETISTLEQRFGVPPLGSDALAKTEGVLG